MDFNYTNRHREIKKKVRSFTLEVINQMDFVKEDNLQFTKEDWRVCGEAGLHGMPIPAEYGGESCDALTTVIALEELGYSCIDTGLPFAIAAQMLSCLVPIWKFGTEEQKKSLLPKLCKGELLIANSITEKNSGSDVYNMNTTAIKDEDGDYVLNGEKTMITNAPLSDMSLVYAVTQADKGYFGGITAFLADHQTEGLESSEELKKIGLESVKMGRQKYLNVKKSADAILGREGSGGPIFSLSMDWERACLGAIHVGLMKKILEFCIDFVKNRKVGNQYINKHQAITHQIANMKVRLHTSRLCIYEAAWSLENRSKSRINSSISKLYISEALEKTCFDAFKIMGGAAYLKGSFIESYLRDSLSATIYSGTSEIQRNIIYGSLKN